LFQNKNKKTITNAFRYDFFFISLLPLLITKSPQPYYDRLNNVLDKKLFLKKSYLILLWLTHLTSRKNKDYTLKITNILPKTKLYTLVKAPMAHKTNSKEQLLFKYFYFRVSFISKHVSMRNQSTEALLNFFPVFETNLLFLKFYRVSVPLWSVSYFKF